MAYGKYTLLYESSKVKYKLLKVWFGADGSYYVTSPYHPAEKAVLFKLPVNYAKAEECVPLAEVDAALLEDDNKRLKLAHHPDGFIQFSGQGIVSGIDASGIIRGMGVKSWPLDAPMRGPAFAVTIRGIEQFAKAEARPDSDVVVFRDQELAAVSKVDAYVIEGHYLPELWRRFVRVNNSGEHIVPILHPCGAVVSLKAIFPTARCERQGFIGLELYTLPCESGAEYESPSFIISSATGLVRTNTEGEIVAVGLYAMYPRSIVKASRALDYRMSEIPPQGVVR